MSDFERTILRNLSRPLCAAPDRTSAAIIKQFIFIIQTIHSSVFIHSHRTNINITLTGNSFVIFTHPTSGHSHSLPLWKFATIIHHIQTSNPSITIHSQLFLIFYHLSNPCPISSASHHLITQALRWIFQFSLFNLSVSPYLTNILVSHLNSLLPHFTESKSDLSVSLDIALSPFPNHIFFPIDHNARQPARACPLKFHHIISTNFIQDTKHFQVLPPSTSSTQISDLIASRIPSAWNHITRSRSVPSLAKVSVMVKPDGVRFRILGDYHDVPHIRLLKLGARAVFALLKLTPLQSFTLFNSTDLKDDIAQFSEHAHRSGLKIRSASFDIKNFFSEIRKDQLIEKFDFVVRLFTKEYRTNFISVPKYALNKKLPPLPAKSTDKNYAYFHLGVLRDIILFSISNAYFALGVHILLQIVGLAMGDPFSPPLAILYVAVDEHNCTLPPVLRVSHDIIILIKRYVDDLQCLIASRYNHDNLFHRLVHFIVNDVYEVGQDVKLLEIVRTFDTKFLDCDIVIFDNSTSVKMIYHNKNSDILFDLFQNVGRFSSSEDPTHISHQINALQGFLVRICDFTSFPQDMIDPSLQIIAELAILGFPISFFQSAVTKTSRSRPSAAWTTVSHFINK